MLDSVISQLKKTNAEVFCTQFFIPHKDISFNVEGVGSVTFPVSPKMAKSLIVEAEPASYGVKNKTLLDQSVRDTWEISKERIQTDSKFESQLNIALKKIQEKLNLPEDGILSAEPHNMLIYMPGQFFKSHQDSEKADGMIASLVITLPSQFTGGEFIVDQHGDKKIFKSSNHSPDDFIFTAFYSDCHHEVKEVKSGYRLTLTYNLFFKPNSQSLSPSRNLDLEKAVNTYFAKSSGDHQNENDFYHPQWLVYLLDHEYTRSSLDWSHLRGLDRDRVSEFLACADHLGLTAHLTLADVHETWSTEGDWDDHYGRRYRNRGDEKKPDDVNYELMELIEDEIVLRHWISRSGEKFEKRDQYAPREVVCWTKAVNQFKPFESQYEGYMGNYGNTLDRWYHRAAIILWKKDEDLINLFHGDKTEALKLISKILKKDINEGQKTLREILPHWPKNIHQVLDPETVLNFAVLTQDSDSASILVMSLGFEALAKKYLLSLLKTIEAYGESWFIVILDSWRKNQSWRSSHEILNELPSLVSAFSQKHKKINHWILQDQLTLVIKDDAGEERDYRRKDARKNMSKKLKKIKILLETSLASGEVKTHTEIIEHILKHPKLYFDVEITNLFLNLDDQSYSDALKQLAARLQKMAFVPRKEGDWSIHEDVRHDCQDCRHLKDFLRDDRSQKLVWPLAEARRSHIHNVIDRMDIQVTHETLRQGSPYRLVLTKTIELFRMEQERANSITRCLEKLKHLND